MVAKPTLRVWGDSVLAGAALGASEAAWVGMHASHRGLPTLVALYGTTIVIYALAAFCLCAAWPAIHRWTAEHPTLGNSQRTFSVAPDPLGCSIALGCALSFRFTTLLILGTTPDLAWLLPSGPLMGAAAAWAWYRAAASFPVLARRRSWTTVFALATLVWLGSAAMSMQGFVRPAAAEGSPNILLVSMDTLRRDHIGVYGSERARTPNIDRLASQSVLFDNAVTPVAYTGPSHTTMLTGLYPIHHGAMANGTAMHPNVATITDYLANAGYRTGAFVSSSVLRGTTTGLDRHFERFDDDSSAFSFVPDIIMQTAIGRFFAETLRISGHLVIDINRPGPRTNRRALKWMSVDPKRPFFAFVHYYDVHAPYNPPPPFDTMYDPDTTYSADNGITLHRIDEQIVREILADPARVEHQRAEYDGGVSYGDAVFGQLLDELNESGLATNTIVVFVADHGESMGEHDFYFIHGQHLYDECIRVPLIIRFPAGQYMGERVAGQVRLTDITPTLLEVAGLDSIADLDGESLMPLIRSPSQRRERVAYGSVWNGRSQSQRSQHYVRAGRYKMIWNFDYRGVMGSMPTFEELYDLDSDASETTNLVSTRKDVAKRLRMLLAEWARPAAVGGSGPDRETIQRLKALGYL